MHILRNVLSVVAGYMVFAVSAVLLFRLSGIDPHADAGLGFIALTMLYGVFFSLVAGMLTQRISGSGRLTVNFALAGLMASFAAFSMFKTSGNHYSQLAAIFLFAPASVFGGVVYLRRKMKGES